MNTSLKIMQTISEIGGLWPSNRPKLKALSMIVWPHLTLPAHSHRGHAHEQFSPLPRPLPHEWARWPYHSDLDLRNKQSKERQSRHKMIRRLTSIRQCKTWTDFQWKHPFQATDRQYRNKVCHLARLWPSMTVLVWPSMILFCCDPVHSMWPSTTVLVWASMTVLVWPSILCFGVIQYTALAW